MHTVNANGAAIPALGFGTFELRDADAYRMVRSALDIGYRHIDTAQLYRNEQAVGRAIADSGIARGEIFLTTKIWVDRFAAGELQKSVSESLQRLNMDYVDLLLLHWPSRSIALAETIPALNAVCRQGATRHIGISNFTTALIDQAADLSDLPLATNQVEYHPLLNQDKVLAGARTHGMSVTAYSPLAQGEVFADSTLQQIAVVHAKNPGQVALRWLIQQDSVTAIPRTRNEAHAQANFDIFDFQLSADEVETINRLTLQNRRTIDPASVAPDWD